jgi:LTXXQ motif family protein
MRQNFLRTVAALALILPALATNAAAQQKKDQGGAAPAVRAAPPPPAPHVAAPAPAPHIAAPVVQQSHIAPVVQQPHIVAQPRIATPVVQQPHIAAAPHVSAPVHVAAPHVATPQIAHVNEGHANSATAIARHRSSGITAAGETGHRGGSTPGNIASSKVVTPNKTNAATTAVAGQNKAGPNRTEAIKTEANKTQTNTPASKLAGPNKTLPNAATPNTQSVVGQGPGARGRNGGNQNAVNQPTLAKAQDQAQAQARARLYVPGRKPILQNQAFANASTRDPALRALAHATFQGRFAQFHDHDRHDRFADRRGFRGIVIGWGGPVFWPYAYDDFVTYTFTPYANDTFWPYAYDDVYDGIFGAYAPDATAYANVPGRRSGPSGLVAGGVATGAAAGGTAQVCSGQASGLTDWPIERIAAQVQPTDQQHLLLDQLKDATANALNLLQSTCATDLPSTPTGRLAAMRQRVASMLQAVQIVRPALDTFYQSLSDEQKERFISLEAAGTTPKAARTTNRQQPNLAQSCAGSPSPITGLPIKQMEQVLRPNDAQQAALDALNNATIQAASLLKENCSQDAQNQPISPPARLAAMEARLNTLLKAVDTVQPAMAKFYNSLTDEQRARFDRLGPHTA